MQELFIQARHLKLDNVLVKDKVMEIKKCRCWGLSLTMGKGLLASTPQIRGLYNLLNGGVFHHAFQEGAAAAPAAGVFSLSPSRMTG